MMIRGVNEKEHALYTYSDGQHGEGVLQGAVLGLQADTGVIACKPEYSHFVWPWSHSRPVSAYTEIAVVFRLSISPVTGTQRGREPVSSPSPRRAAVIWHRVTLFAVSLATCQAGTTFLTLI